MDTNEKALLQAEIIRLNRIIDALIAENSMLKGKNPLSQLSEALPNVGISVSQPGIGNPNTVIPASRLSSGNTDSEITVSQLIKGNPNTGIPSVQSGSGNPDSKIPPVQLTKGNPDRGISLSQQGTGNPNVQKGMSEVGNGNTKDQAARRKTSLFKSKPEQLLDYYLYHHLGMKTKKSGRKHSAMLLLHFYHSSRGAHAELMKLTGLSIGGLTKQLEMFKKKGWLVKDGWQQFKLTDEARRMVEEAVGE